MMAGEGAGDAAALARASGVALHDLDTAELRKRLVAHDAIVDPPLEPLAAFAFEPAQPAPGNPVSFRYTVPDGASKAVECYWDFDGDGKTDSVGASPMHVFAAAKATIVTLVVKDAQNRFSQPYAEILHIAVPNRATSSSIARTRS